MGYIDKSDLVAEIKRLLAFYLKEIEDNKEDPWAMDIAKRDILQEIISFIDTLEVKEVEETKQRMKECPFRQDICNRYRGTQVKCDGKCSWVVDHLKLKELKAQKGEEV